MSFHSSLYKMHLNNSLKDRYWILAFFFFLHSICVYITFPIIYNFSGKKETRILDKGPRAKKRTNQKPMPILNHPLRFSFYISEKTGKVIIVSNFVQDLVPVKYCLTSASHSNIMVYLFSTWRACNLPNPFVKVLCCLAFSPLFRVVSQKIVLNFSVKHYHFSCIFCSIHVIRHEHHSFQGNWKFGKSKGIHMSQWECIRVDVQLAWLYNVWVTTQEIK